MRARVFGALLALVPGLASAEVSVTLRGGRLDLKATAAPLSEILGQLARQTGMKVVNDEPIPSMILTLSLEDRTPVEAVLGVLQGLGLDYALATDYAGMRVETLIISGLAARGSGPTEPPPVRYSRAESPTEPALPSDPSGTSTGDGSDPSRQYRRAALHARRQEPSAVGEAPEAPEAASPPVEVSAGGTGPATATATTQPPPVRRPVTSTFHPSTFTRPDQVTLPAPFVPGPPK